MWQTFCFFRFVKFETKQDQFCVWFYSLVQLPTEASRVFFIEPFSKRETTFSYFFLPLVLVQYLDKIFFVPYRRTQSRKIS